jgi:hypothetical protein
VGVHIYGACISTVYELMDEAYHMQYQQTGGVIDDIVVLLVICGIYESAKQKCLRR